MNLLNAWYTAFRWYNPDVKLHADMWCPDDMVYFCDAKGRVHCFRYEGMIPRPSDPGYAPVIEEEDE